MYPKIGSWWQAKNGRCYKVLMITNIHPTERRPTTVVYRSLHGELYSRPLNGWFKNLKEVHVNKPGGCYQPHTGG